MTAFTDKFLLAAARYLRAVVFTCFNLEVLLNVGLALASTYVTSKQFWNIRYKLDSFFVSMAIITPLMHIIGTAFARRERAASNMAALKSHCMTFYILHRDQHKDPPGNLSTVGDNTSKHARQAADLIVSFLESVEKYMVGHKTTYESHAELMLSYLPRWNWLTALVRNKVNFRALAKKDAVEAQQLQKDMDFLSQNLQECYQKLTHLAMWNEKVIVKWGFLKPGENAPPGRTNTLLGNMSQAFENLRLIRQYRTPVMLRYGVRILIYIYAVFMGPYFNDICTTFETYESNKLTQQTLRANLASNETVVMPASKQFSAELRETCYVNYIVATLFLMSVTMLMRIGRDIEYPFDMQGLDDLFFEGAHDFQMFTEIKVPDGFRKLITDEMPDDLDEKLRRNHHMLAARNHDDMISTGE